MNWSADDVTEVSLEVVTVISTRPTVPAGAVAVICVADCEVMLAVFAPNLTVDVALKPDPVMITLVPPPTGPELVPMLDTLGR